MYQTFSASPQQFFSRRPPLLLLHTVYQSSEEQLLYSVNGEVPKGALCALMGPSGAGKSKLLDLLTGRAEFGRCEGEVLFNGRSVVDQRVQLLNRRLCAHLAELNRKPENIV